MLRTASSLPRKGLLTLGSDPARFQTEPPACYRASWQLPGPDFHRQATTSLRTRRNTMALRHGVTSRSAGRTKNAHCLWPSRRCPQNGTRQLDARPGAGGRDGSAQEMSCPARGCPSRSSTSCRAGGSSSTGLVAAVAWQGSQSSLAGPRRPCHGTTTARRCRPLRGWISCAGSSGYRTRTNSGWQRCCNEPERRGRAT
jgi:hypothetical protein